MNPQKQELSIQALQKNNHAHPILNRLKEALNNKKESATDYSRMHHRHNRS